MLRTPSKPPQVTLHALPFSAALGGMCSAISAAEPPKFAYTRPPQRRRSGTAPSPAAGRQVQPPP